eukprot:scaffold27644_cov56-Isochrysis_galbana.AAC.1
MAYSRFATGQRATVGDADGISSFQLVEADIAHPHGFTSLAGDGGCLAAHVRDEDLAAVAAVVLALHLRSGVKGWG